MRITDFDFGRIVSAGFIQQIRRRLISIGLGLATAALVLAVIAVVVRYQAPASTNSREMSYEATRLDVPAPGFRPVNQKRTSLSLSDFRGRIVVLTLLDPYGVVRPPQYTGIFLAEFGKLVHWPTLATLALAPLSPRGSKIPLAS